MCKLIGFCTAFRNKSRSAWYGANGHSFWAISAVKNYIGIAPHITQPAVLHPHRIITGMDTSREEPSGHLLWSTIASLFPRSADFFSRCFVLNYCPLAFFSATGKNITPDALIKQERLAIEQCCTDHLIAYIRAMNIQKILAIGRYAYEKSQNVLQLCPAISQNAIIYIPHPSPLNRNRSAFAPTLQNALI